MLRRAQQPWFADKVEFFYRMGALRPFLFLHRAFLFAFEEEIDCQYQEGKADEVIPGELLLAEEDECKHGEDRKCDDFLDHL